MVCDTLVAQEWSMSAKETMYKALCSHKKMDILKIRKQ